MKKLIFTLLLMTMMVCSVNALRVAGVNAALVLMFHPEMRDYMPEYSRFTANSYEFEGVETERIAKREQRIEEKSEKRDRLEKEVKEMNRKIGRKMEELSDIVAAKNRELFELNAEYRAEMKNLQVNEMAKKEKERENEYNKIIKKYESDIQRLNDEIAGYRDSIADRESELRAKEAAEFLNKGTIFLPAAESRAKAQRIVDTMNSIIKDLAREKGYDLILNRSLYSPLGNIKGTTTFEKVFTDDHGLEENEIMTLPTDVSSDDDDVDQPTKPLHNLLDSDEEIDIVKFYSLRYMQLEEVARPFYPPLISKNVLYGDEFKVREDLTRKVIERLFDRYNVREFEREIGLRLYDRIMEVK